MLWLWLWKMFKINLCHLLLFPFFTWAGKKDVCILSQMTAVFLLTEWFYECCHINTELQHMFILPTLQFQRKYILSKCFLAKESKCVFRTIQNFLKTFLVLFFSFFFFNWPTFARSDSVWKKWELRPLKDIHVGC